MFKIKLTPKRKERIRVMQQRAKLREPARVNAQEKTPWFAAAAAKGMTKQKEKGMPWYYWLLGVMLYAVIETYLRVYQRVSLGGIPTVLLLLVCAYFLPKLIWNTKTRKARK
jgi:hypothetical protein